MFRKFRTTELREVYVQVAEQILPVKYQTLRYLMSSLLWLIVIGGVLASTTAFAQLAGKGAISGRVEDPTGATIPNAKLTITNTATGISTGTTSTDAGDYSVQALDPGNYTVSVEAPGFEKQKQENVTVNALETATYNPKLTVGASTATVNVSAAPPQLETSNATVGETLEAELYAALPVEMGGYGSADQRRVTDFADLMPGVSLSAATGGGTTQNSGVISGGGERGNTAGIYIEGLPFINLSEQGDPRFVWSAISVDAVDQFQVETSGYPATYEGQGVENYAVKQGGAKYHVAAYEFFRNTALDSWGFFKTNSPTTGLPTKPVEHMNEYGFNLSGPPLPFGSLRKKLFYFGNFSFYKESVVHPATMTFPSVAEQHGNFQGIQPIYDPNSQTACTAFYGYECRYRFGYTNGATPSSPQALNGQPVDVIPTSEFDPVAQNIQAPLTTLVNPYLINSNSTNNYISPDLKGLQNSSQTHRVDYIISSSDTLTGIYAHGHQQSNVPVGFSIPTSNNIGPLPYNKGQAYNPQTYVATFEETHVFSPHVVNQLKYGFARYASDEQNVNWTPKYSATALGYTGAPAGQASGAFPSVTFSGIDAPTNFAGYTANIAGSNNYVLVDNVQWEFGKHSITIGGMISWLQYEDNPATGGTTPITIANTVTETSGIQSNGSLIGSTGVPYASFLLGQADNVSFTQNAVQATYARFRPISPYIQDTWKVTEKLTLDLGLRYDYYPTYREKNNVMSYFDPNLPNPITGVNGALNFAGHGAGTCNCNTPVHSYFKNISPRLGLAYQIDPKTVIRSSYGVMYTQGNAVGGSSESAQGTNTLGFSASPNNNSNTVTYLSAAPLRGGLPAYAPALGVAAGPGYGTGYTTTAGHTGSPSTLYYGDTYLGGRAPQFIDYSFAVQHQWTANLTSTITYVGSQGHFLQPDGVNIRGRQSDTLDPVYLGLGSCLSASIATLASKTNAAGMNCQTAVQQSGAVIPAWFNTKQNLAQALKPFPQYAVTDEYNNVANSHYNGLQASLNLHLSHGVTFMANYLWSRAIDNDGTFRTGYAIPAAYSNLNRSFGPGEIERTVSIINQPHHFVFTGVEHLPFGTGQLGGGHAWERAIFGGYVFSQIVQTYSGTPLNLTASSCQTNPAQITCEPTLNPSFHGNARSTKHWSGFGPNIVPSKGSATVAPTGPFITPALVNSSYIPAYTFGNAPRTSPWGLTGPGMFTMDVSLRRSFPLYFTEGARLTLQADLYNVTNFVQFSIPNLSVGNGSFGVPSSQANNPRQGQLSARVEF